MSNEEEDEERLSPELRAAFAAEEPPAGFAERVVATWHAEREARPVLPRRRGLSLVVGALTLTAAAALLVWVRPAPSPTGSGERVGDHRVAERATFNLGGRATAVAEAGSALSWQVARGGAARVQQTEGDVFYRVEKGGPFVVSTPAGEVTVLGTCFRVEVRPMSVDKKSLVAAGAGALAAATVLVTVYEGRVLLANARGRAELAAGERGAAQGAGAPARLAARTEVPAAAATAVVPAPPAADVSREDLLKRDAAQRQELAQLHAKLKEYEATHGPGVEERQRGERFFAPSKDELLQMAKECKLQWDSPQLSLTPHQMSEGGAQQEGLSPEERRQLNRVTAEFNQRMASQLRALYVEVTGDKVGADLLTPQAMQQDIMAKVPDEATQEAFWRLSHERAGLLAPSSDPRGSPPVERLMRLLTSAGDEYERELGAAIGPDRAHALRAAHGSWGARNTSSTGCPSGR